MTRNRPQFTGQRLTVFGWQIDQLNRMLGRHADEFDTFGWLFDFDQTLAATGDVVPPQHEQQRFIEDALINEARKRGLPMAQTIRMGKLTARMAAMVRGEVS